MVIPKLTTLQYGRPIAEGMTFGAKLLVNDRRISFSNEVKIVKIRTKVTSLQVTSTFAMEYFVALIK